MNVGVTMIADGMARQSEIYSRWATAMRRGRFFRAGERIGIAVSGGPDSTLLLSFACDLAREIGFCPAVVHFNHRLRGAESDEDEAFVAASARSLHLRFYHAHADVLAAARRQRKNLEATARDLRYRYFFSLVRRGSLDRIATAHTANDQAETVLLRLLRGTGTRGLGGIFPQLEGGIVRPFLGITRSEVEREIVRRGLAFRQDGSNRDLRFARNRIRLELLPRLEREFNPAIVHLLASLAERARDDDAYLEQQAAELSRPWRLRREDGERISLRALTTMPASIERRVLRQMIEGAGQRSAGVTARHVEELREWAARAQSGKLLEIAGSVEARREFEWLVIGQRAAASPGSYSIPVTPPAKVVFQGGELTFRASGLPSDSSRESLKKGRYSSNGMVYIDMDKLPGPLLLRNWQAGDCFHPWGAARPKKLKEAFQKLRVPAGQRQAWPVLVSEDRVIWTRRLPPDRCVTIGASTRRVLVIEGSIS